VCLYQPLVWPLSKSIVGDSLEIKKKVLTRVFIVSPKKMLSAITPPENALFSALQQKNTSVRTIVTEWFEDFENDPVSARLQLLRLIFAVSYFIFFDDLGCWMLF
jgi:hypothetical protein